MEVQNLSSNRVAGAGYFVGWQNVHLGTNWDEFESDFSRKKDELAMSGDNDSHPNGSKLSGKNPKLVGQASGSGNKVSFYSRALSSILSLPMDDEGRDLYKRLMDGVAENLASSDLPEGSSGGILPDFDEATSKPVRQTAPHILCVDDEQDILSVAKMTLETVGGYKVSCCSSGLEALEHVGQLKPDLILLDVMMPQMGGLATMDALKRKAETITTPIVFMTARVQPAEVKEYLSLGAAAVVHKPFDPMQLPGQIGEILQQLKIR